MYAERGESEKNSENVTVTLVKQDPSMQEK